MTETKAIKQAIPFDQLQSLIDSSPLASSFNTRVGQCLDGYAEIHLPITEKLYQHRGIVNGAVIGFVADTAVCIAAATKVGDVRTQEYKVNFIAPAMGQELIGKGSIISTGFSQVIARADVYAVNNGNSYLVATALATLYVV